MKNICIIPARSGSKRIKDKNIKEFMGKPIIAYAIETAIQSRLFDKIITSSDSSKYLEIAREWGAEVYQRNSALSDDYTTMDEVLIDVLNNQHEACDTVCCIYPTNPFITTDILKSTYSNIIEQKADCLIPVLPYPASIQKAYYLKDGQLKMYIPNQWKRRSQDCTVDYYDVGGFYWVDVEALMMNGSSQFNNTIPWIMNPLLCQDIDTEEDWEKAEKKYMAMMGDK